MIDIYSLMVMTAAVLTAIAGAVLLFRRRRVQRAYDEMRKAYGKEWTN